MYYRFLQISFPVVYKHKGTTSTVTTKVWAKRISHHLTSESHFYLGKHLSCHLFCIRLIRLYLHRHTSVIIKDHLHVCGACKKYPHIVLSVPIMKNSNNNPTLVFKRKMLFSQNIYEKRDAYCNGPSAKYFIKSKNRKIPVSISKNNFILTPKPSGLNTAYPCSKRTDLRYSKHWTKNFSLKFNDNNQVLSKEFRTDTQVKEKNKTLKTFSHTVRIQKFIFLIKHLVNYCLLPK